MQASTSAPLSFSPTSPDLIQGMETFRGVQRLLSVLPPALRSKIDNEIQIYIASQTPFAACFYPPRYLVVNEVDFANVGMATLAQFYEALAQIIAKDLIGEPEFNESRFVEKFAFTAIRRQEKIKDAEYVPSDHTPTPTNIFLKNIWSSKEKSSDLKQLWVEARREAYQRDRYHILRAGAPIFRTPGARFVGSSASETVRYLKEHSWELDTTLQGESDPTTLRNRTTFRLQGIWKQFDRTGTTEKGEIWQYYPGMTMEGRFANPLSNSDLLLLGGWHTLLEKTEGMELSLAPQAGYSLRKSILFGQKIPGVELAANLNKTLEDDFIKGPSYWQISFVTQYGFSHLTDPNGLVVGLMMKWVI